MIGRVIRVPERFPRATIVFTGLVLATAYAAGLVLLAKPSGRIVSGDAVHYYVYLRSVVFDRDLQFENDYVRLIHGGTPTKPGAWMPARTESGYARNVMSVGPALVCLPLFLLVTAGVWVARLFGSDYPLDGFGTIFQASAGFSGILAATAGAWMTYRLLNRWFPRRAAIWATLGVWLGSSAVYYSTVSPTYSHAASMMAVSAFFLVWARSLEYRTPGAYAWLGAAAGLAALIRWQEATLLIVPLLDVLVQREGIRRSVTNLLAAGAGFLVVFAPQMVVWWVLYGSPFTIPQGAGFMRWQSPAVLSVLFSARRGLFTWTPILALAVGGLVFAMRRAPRLTAYAIVLLALAIYVNASVADWWAGEAFGARRFVACFPLFAVGLAAYFAWLREGSAKVPAIVFTFVFLNGLLLLQYQLALHGFEHIAPYPEDFQALLIERWMVPFRLLRLLTGS